MIELKHKKIVVNNKQIGYWINENEKPRNIFVFLSPGPSSGDFFTHYSDKFSDRDLFIFPDYPGRGISDTQSDNSIEGIATAIDNLIVKLCYKQIILVGLSFGSQIATSLLKNNLESKYIAGVLVASGEYFTPILRSLMFVPFKIFTYSHRLRMRVNYFLKRNKIIEFLPKRNLKEINLQWISTLQYKIPKNIQVETPVVFVDYALDRYVNVQSRVKLRKMFVNSVTEVIKQGHPYDYAEFDSFFQLFNKIYNKDE